MTIDLNRTVGEVLRDERDREEQRGSTSSITNRTIDDLSVILSCVSDLLTRQVVLRYPSISSLRQLDPRTRKDLIEFSLDLTTDLLPMVNRMTDVVSRQGRRAAA